MKRYTIVDLLDGVKYESNSIGGPWTAVSETCPKVQAQLDILNGRNSTAAPEVRVIENVLDPGVVILRCQCGSLVEMPRELLLVQVGKCMSCNPQPIWIECLRSMPEGAVDNWVLARHPSWPRPRLINWCRQYNHWRNEQDERAFFVEEPTHWMPLPRFKDMQ